jgi:hypothetical protein
MSLHDEVADIAFRYQFKKNSPIPQLFDPIVAAFLLTCACEYPKTFKNYRTDFKNAFNGIVLSPLLASPLAG